MATGRRLEHPLGGLRAEQADAARLGQAQVDGGLVALLVVGVDHGLGGLQVRPALQPEHERDNHSLAEQFVEKCQLFADNVVMLLRVNWLGSAERTKFFYKNMPDIYVLPNRPSFKKSTNANSDPTEYAWFHWSQRRSNSGKIRRLDETPVEIRSKQQAELYKIYEYYYGTG